MRIDEVTEELAVKTSFDWFDKAIDSIVNKKKYKKVADFFVNKWIKEHPTGDLHGEVQRVAKMTNVDFRQLERVLHAGIEAGIYPKELAHEF